MDKFGRNYLLEIQQRDGKFVPLIPPITVEFDVIRHSLQSTNVGQFRIYNLSAEHRNQFGKNAISYDFKNRGIKFSAGYGNNLNLIFKGTIGTAWSTREGVNFITQIESFDGGFDITNGFFNKAYPNGTPLANIIEDMASAFPRSTIGAVGSFPGVLLRGNSYNGNTAYLLDELTGGGFFIDNEKVYALGQSEFIASPGLPIVVDADSGLLGTPVLEETIVHFDMIFEPTFNVGTAIVLKSKTYPALNRTYKLTRVQHRGLISGAVCGDVITTCEFSYVEGQLTGVQPIAS